MTLQDFEGQKLVEQITRNTLIAATVCILLVLCIYQNSSSL